MVSLEITKEFAATGGAISGAILPVNTSSSSWISSGCACDSLAANTKKQTKKVRRFIDLSRHDFSDGTNFPSNHHNGVSAATLHPESALGDRAVGLLASNSTFNSAFPPNGSGLSE
jgi:hypothetical protein